MMKENKAKATELAATTIQNVLFTLCLKGDIIRLIMYMKKLLDSDWLRAVQFKCNTSAKSVTSVQKV